MHWFNWFTEYLLAALTACGLALGPVQPAEGPGGTDYRHDSVRMVDRAGRPDGYWWFEPQDPVPDTARLILFLHGYGNFNPMIYGGWIRHLVRQGYVVLFPRYQRNLFFPFPARFVPHTQTAFHRARSEVPGFSSIRWDTSRWAAIGHSYGGVIAAHLAVRHRELGLPRLESVMLVMPGSAGLPGGRLRSYAGWPDETQLLAVVGALDGLVGEEFANKVVRTAARTARTALLKIHPDGHGRPKLLADHVEAYAPLPAFDSGDARLNSRRALRKGECDALDFYGLWKWADQLLECSPSDTVCALFSRLPEQVYLGAWSDRQPIRPAEIEIHPNLLPRP